MCAKQQHAPEGTPLTCGVAQQQRQQRVAAQAALGLADAPHGHRAVAARRRQQVHALALEPGAQRVPFSALLTRRTATALSRPAASAGPWPYFGMSCRRHTVLLSAVQYKASLSAPGEEHGLLLRRYTRVALHVGDGRALALEQGALSGAPVQQAQLALPQGIADVVRIDGDLAPQLQRKLAVVHGDRGHLRRGSAARQGVLAAC